MQAQRSTGVFAALVLAAGLTLAGTAPAGAAAAPCWDVASDFDGGGPDVVVGLPSYDLPGKADAGAIVLFSNVAAQGDADPKAPTARTLLTADDFGLTPQAGARFGSAVTLWGDAADFDDADDCADLLVGAPGQTVSGQVGAGRVYLLGGSEMGLSTVKKVFDETMVGADGPEPGDEFGAAIAASAWTSIVVGAPGRDVREIPDSGRVLRLNWQDPADEPDVVLVDQDGEEDEGSEAGDRFGEVLTLTPTADGEALLVGIPHEDVGATVDAGAIALYPPNGDEPSMMTQNRRGAGGTAEAGDLYGSSIALWWTFLVDHPVARIAVGVPGEDVQSSRDAGAVGFVALDYHPQEHPAFEALSGMGAVLTQDSVGIPGAVEPGDRYGSLVVTGEFGQDNGRLNLLVGSPLEDLGSTADAGQLSMTRFETDQSPTTGVQPSTWTQDSPGVSGKAESGDRFGAAGSAALLTVLEDDDDSIWPVLLVTVPREDVGAVKDAGMAFLGYPPGQVSVALALPVTQAGAGIGMVPMRSDG